MAPSLLILGLISILGQVTLLRELNVTFFGVELIYSLALGSWLLWTASGAMLSRRSSPSILGIHFLFLSFSLLLPLDVAFIRAIRILFAPSPGAYLPFLTQILTLALSLLPIGLLLGLLFQWASRSYITSGGTLARAYAIECLGGLIGGLLATLFLKYGVSNFVIVVLGSLTSLSAVFLNPLDRMPRMFRWLLGALTAAVFCLFWLAPRFDRMMTTWNHPYLLSSRDTPYSRVSVTKLEGQVSVFENDALSFETEGTTAEEFVHLAALQHSRPKKVLLLGGAIEGLIKELLQHSPRQIDCVELDRSLFDEVTPHLPGSIQDSLKDSRVRIWFGDPREYLDKAGRYDLILVAMPEPASGQTNRFYTVEFFRRCAAHLDPGGIVAFRLLSSENLWTPQLTLRNASIYRALNEVFPEISVLPGNINIFSASLKPLPGAADLLVERFHQRQIQASLISPPYLQYLYNNDRFREIRMLLKDNPAPVNSDVRPICFQYTVLIWLSKFFPDLVHFDLSALTVFLQRNRHWSELWVVALMLAFLFARRRILWRCIGLAAVSGFAGMLLETLLILRFQVEKGILFQDLGLLMMSVMAGMSVGAIGMDCVQRRRADQGTRARSSGALLLAGFAVLSAFLGLSSTATWGGLPGTTAALFACGVFIAGVFAYASRGQTANQNSLIGPLYSADLIGGCAGSLWSSLFLVPLVGLCGSALALMPLLAISFLLI